MIRRITVISDTHSKHNQVRADLPGGNVLIHAGDISSLGYPHEIDNFCKWFDKLDDYDHKIFIAGNHDFLFENHPNDAAQIVNSFKWFHYLQDSWVQVGEDIEDRLAKIYGSPWQPEFLHWAFNLKRNGPDLKKVWDDIPDDTDILVTHGPPHGILDTVGHFPEKLGCEILAHRVYEVRPKIHVFGHIHSGNGYFFDGTTHYFNASVLNERYIYEYKPRTFDWDDATNSVEFIK